MVHSPQTIKSTWFGKEKEWLFFIKKKSQRCGIEKERKRERKKKGQGLLIA